jgi:hypothetical protein
MVRDKHVTRSLCLFAILFLAQALSAQQAAPSTLKISDGTTVRLALMDALSSATNEVDDPVNLEVTEEVKVGDVVAIARGSTARGHVVEAEGKRRMGRAGKLNFSVDFVKGPDGSNVRLRASSLRKGEDKTGTVIVGTIMLGGLFLLMRGKDVNIPKGTQFNAYVDGDREIALVGSSVAVTQPAAPQPAPTAQPATPQPAPGATTEELTTVVLKSTPDGSDITVDGKFLGSTPSTVRLAAGEHTIIIEKAGHKTWQRTMSVNPGGIVTIDATLERVQ